MNRIQKVDIRIVPSGAIIEFVCQYTGFTQEQILGTLRFKELTRARWMAVRMMELQKVSTMNIGAIMKRDHSSIVYAIHRMRQVATHDQDLADMLIEAEAALYRMAAEGAATAPVITGNSRQVLAIRASIEKADRARRREAWRADVARREEEERVAEAEAKRAAEEAERRAQEFQREIAAKIGSSKFARLKRERWSPASISRQMGIPIEYVKRALGIDLEAV